MDLAPAATPEQLDTLEAQIDAWLAAEQADNPMIDAVEKGEREVGFIPRPLRPPKERLLMTPDASVHFLMERIEAVDREIGLPVGWFFLMTHGHWVDPDVGLAIAQGLKAQRVRLPDPDAGVLLRWAWWSGRRTRPERSHEAEWESG